jgi:hypothetical protein
MYQLVDFKAEHARSIFNMNDADMPVPENDLIQGYLSQGSVAKSLLFDGIPLGCGGIINIGWRRGEAWLLTNRTFYGQLKTVYSYIFRVFPLMVREGGFVRVQATCFNLHNGNLFRHLGFEMEASHMKKYGPLGEPAALWARVFEEAP